MDMSYFRATFVSENSRGSLEGARRLFFIFCGEVFSRLSFSFWFLEYGAKREQAFVSENPGSSLGWRAMIIIGAVVSTLLALVVIIMLESPQWLIMKGRLRDAKGVLDRTSTSKDEARLRLADIKQAVGVPEECDEDVIRDITWNTCTWRDLFQPTPSICHMLVCVVRMQFIYQLCGTDTISLYISRIYDKARIIKFKVKLIMNIGIDFVKISFLLVATFLTDRVGRRFLMLSSIGGMIVSLLSLGVWLIRIDHSSRKLR